MEDIIGKKNIYIYVYIYFRNNKKIQSSFSVLLSFSVLQVYYIINNINRY